mmetsp:Transcript_18980/g.45046  ORF Transcript_18980/g.45046 Transcript_18980/m.45046 type:complete len:319 (-) Transcript_18980:661-1617(-)
MLVVAVRLDHVGRPRRGQGLAVGQAVQLVNACGPAEGGAGGPNGAAVVLLGHHGHHEGGVDLRGGPHADGALVAAVPDHDGGMRGKPADLVSELCVLHVILLRRVPGLRVHHVVENHQAQLIAGLVELVGQKDAAAPDAERVHASVRGGAYQHAVGLPVHPALQLLHGDDVGAFGPEGDAVDPEVHALAVGALLQAGPGHVGGVRVVARDQREVAEPHGPRGAGSGAGAGAKRGAGLKSHLQVVEVLLPHAHGPPELHLVRAGLRQQRVAGVPRRHLDMDLFPRLAPGGCEPQKALGGGRGGQEDVHLHAEARVLAIH